MASTADSDKSISGAADEQWRKSLLEVMQQVVHKLPDHTSLGELVGAMRENPTLVPVLRTMSVQELIEMAVSRPRYHEPDVSFDEDGNPTIDLPDTGPGVIRRRADAPDGELRVLRSLSDEGAMNEASLTRLTRLTSEQIRMLIRHLRTKGLIHVEGSGGRRHISLTRNGGQFLRKQSRRRDSPMT